MLGSDGSLLVAQNKDIGGDDALKLRQKTRTRSRTNTTVSSFQTTDTVLPMLPASAGATAATSVASRDTTTFMPARRTLTLEEFKYAFESWRQTTARAGVAFLQLVHCNA